LKLSDLKASKYNPRKITEKALSGLTYSISEFGDISGIVFNRKTGNLVTGHQRVKILLQKYGDLEFNDGQISTPDGKTFQIRYVEWDLSKEKAANIAANSTTIQGEFTTDIDELLKDIKLDLSKAFEEMDFKNIDIPIRTFIVDEDEIPEYSKNIKSKLGDLYELGKHRILCGDATNKDDVIKLMGDKRADMIFTDPPYSIGYGKHTQKLSKMFNCYSKSRTISTITGDNLTVDECANKIWLPAFKNLFDISEDDCSVYCTMPQGGYMMMMMNVGWQIKHQLIWVKNSQVFSAGRLDYDYKHEPIMYGWKNKHKFYGNGEFKTSVWEVPKPLKSDLHPTMKPIRIIVNALMNSSLENNIIVDTFLGSGSTLIACEQVNRVCYGMEIEPMYCDVIVQRWVNITNQKNIKLNGKSIIWNA
jgi:DNA modification methylase